MKTPRTCCIILAAGLSSRMGRFKPLLPIAGKPAVQFLLEKLCRAGVNSCVIVTGHHAQELRDACKNCSNIIWGYNPDYAATGMMESAKIGFSLVPEDCERILLTPADIPLVKEETIEALIRTDAPLLFPSFHFRKGHPVSLAKQLLPELIRYSGPNGLHGAFQSLPVAPSYLETEDRFILLDMDTPEDYENLLSYIDAGDDSSRAILAAASPVSSGLPNVENRK